MSGGVVITSMSSGVPWTRALPSLWACRNLGVLAHTFSILCPVFFPVPVNDFAWGHWAVVRGISVLLMRASAYLEWTCLSSWKRRISFLLRWASPRLCLLIHRSTVLLDCWSWMQGSTVMQDIVPSKIAWLTQIHKMQEARPCTLSDGTKMQSSAPNPPVCWGSQLGVISQQQVKRTGIDTTAGGNTRS